MNPLMSILLSAILQFSCGDLDTDSKFGNLDMCVHSQNKEETIDKSLVVSRSVVVGSR